MQDEVNEKVVALSIKGAKLTAEMLQKAMKEVLSQVKKEVDKQAIPHGKQTLRQLTGACALPRACRHREKAACFPL